MAPPALQTYNTFTDTEVRDIYHRHQHQVVPTGNVIHKLHTHYDTQNSAPILSSVQASTMDATNANGAWNLLLRSDTTPLSEADITTANAESWTANSTITATSALTTLRSGNVRVTGNLNANIVTSTSLTVTDTGNVNNLTANVFTANSGNLNSLFVSGDITSNGTLTLSAPGAAGTLRISQSEVLSIDTLGETVVNSSLRNFGILETLNVDGSTNMNNVRTRYFHRSLPLEAIQDQQGTKFSTIEASPGGAFTVELNMIQSTNNNNSIARIYKFPVYFNATNGEWRTLLPISSSGASNGNEIGILAKVTGNVQNSIYETQFCLYKSSDGPSSSATQITITMQVHQNDQFPVTITQNDSPEVLAGPYATYSGTLIHQSAAARCVGINTDTPDSDYTMHVNGSLKCTSTTATQAVNSAGNVNASGAVNAYGGLVNFSNKFRFYYNPDADALEIQRNVAGTWTKTATLAV
jgi:hypothetical protein